MAGRTIYLMRLEKLSAEIKEHVLSEEPFALSEIASRRWHIEEGDDLLFSIGSGSELRFLGRGVATEVRRRAVEPDERGDPPRHEVSIRVANVIRLRDTPHLETFMYSLRQVGNFRTPSLHFRHHVRVHPADLETLQHGQINELRSIFYGLLRHLSPRWRSYLETVARLRALAQGARAPIEDSQALTRQVLDQLLSAISLAVVLPAELATDIGKLQVQSGLSHVPALVREDDHTWNFDALLDSSRAFVRSAASDWQRLRTEARRAQDGTAESGTEWRRHHW